MEIEAFIKKLKDIYSVLINFIDADDDSEFERVITIFDEQQILESKEEIGLIIQLMSKLSDNHHRTSNFFDKIEKIFRYLMKNTLSPILNFISDYTEYNRRIIFLLLDKKIIQPDEAFINSFLQGIKSSSSYYYYLYPKMKEYLEEQKQKEIEEEIIKKYEEKISTFEEKCQIGENDSYICSLIRTDSVEEFISYVNRTNLSLLTQITPSIYETNYFLTDKKPTLIEYAAFFGSIQIIQFLKFNKVPLTSSLWLYTVHSNNVELIHFLEENKVELVINKYDYNSTLKESIISHHNDISNYIKNLLYDRIQTDYQNKFYDDFGDIIYNSLNFFFFPSKIESIICQPIINNKGFKLSQLCFSLKIITIPSSVTSIGDCAFYECSKLTKVIIPSSVTSIGNLAFYECSSLQQISIENPSSITSIGLFVFLGCSSLEQIPIQFSNRNNEYINTILLGSPGSGKTLLSWILSGKDVKVKISTRNRPTFEGFDHYDCDFNYPMHEIVTDESNKIAYIELHGSEFNRDIDEQLNFIKCLLKANKNEVKVKVLIVFSEYEIDSSHGTSYNNLFRRFKESIPNLNNSERKAIGIVITRGDYELESNDYINIMLDNVYDENAKEWYYYFRDHQEQCFMMPKPLRSMKGKSFDFKDKDRIIDFIKRNQ